MTPKLSVVIASTHSADSLADCIASFVNQPGADEIELIIAESSNHRRAEQLRSAYPSVRVLHFDEPKSIPELRAIGLLNARGAIVAMTEDHCLADTHWVANVLRAHQSPHWVIGGAVENAATERLIDWAVFFCEYGRYMLPIAPGPTADLPGPNVSYKREALERFGDLLEAATWEPLWHGRLLSQGVQLINDPNLVMYHRKHFTMRGFLSERYHYARSFAGARVADASVMKRWLFAWATPILPMLLFARITLRAWRKGRHRRELLLSLPYIVLFTLSGSFGELIGYLRGPGDSLLRIA